MHADEVPPVQCQQRAASAVCEAEYRIVGDSLIRLSCLEGGKHVVPQASKGAYAASFCWMASSISCRCASTYAQA